MLRVGLTGELGSGKSTVARMLAEHGAVVLSSDEMARAMMQPGQAVYEAIVTKFGAGVVLPDGQLNRPELARLAFSPDHARVEELNAIVHPAVLAEQERRIGEIAASEPHAIVVVESALIFTTKHAGEEPWRKRFDRIILVTAPDAAKIARFVQRTGHRHEVSGGVLAALQDQGYLRLSQQRIPTDVRVDFFLENDGGMDELRLAVDRLWEELLSLRQRLTTGKLDPQN